MYKAIEFFTDAQDNYYAYNVGDPFPRQGISVSKARLNYLASSDNKRHRPVIKMVDGPAKVDKVVEADTKETDVIEANTQKPKRRGKKKDADGDMSRA